MKTQLKEDIGTSKPHPEDTRNLEADVIHSGELARRNISKAIEKRVFNVDEISDLNQLLTELRDKGLVGLPNYNNGTMYYVPEDAIGKHNSKTSISGINITSDKDDQPGAKHFAATLGSMVTQNISQVEVLNGAEYVKTNTREETFAILENHPDCVKISGLQESNINVRRVLFFRKEDGTTIALNFVNDEGLPFDLSGFIQTQ